MQLNIATKLPAVIVGLVVIALGINSTVAIIDADSALLEQESDKLIGLQHSRAETLKNYLQSIEQDLKIIADNDMVIDGLTGLEDTFLSLGQDATTAAQELYIHDNPHPVGEKHKLLNPNDGSAFSYAHAAIHPWFTKLMEERGYYDVFLVSHPGDVVYSVYKELDFGTNLAFGKWAGTDLGKVFQKIKANPERGFVAFSDFAPYEPSANAPAGFIGTPVFDHDGEFHGVLIFQVPIDRIDHIMHNAEGLGKTGKSYLVGADFLMRSNSRFSDKGKTTTLQQTADSEAVKNAFNGEEGVIITTDYHGEDVVSAFGTIKFHGVTWAVITEIDEDEMLIPVHDMQLAIILASVVIALIAAGAGFFFARSVTRPIVDLTGAMDELAKDNLSVEIPGLGRPDEIGEMAKGVQLWKDAASEAVRLKEQQERDRIAAEEEKQRAIRTLADEISGVAGAASSGDLTARLDLSGKTDELLEVGQSLNTLVATVEQGLNETGSVLSALADGNLKERVHGEYQGAFLRLKSDTNTTTERLSATINDISRATGVVLNASAEIAEGADDLASRTEQQASSLEQTAAAMEELVATVRQNADSSKKANEFSATARQAAEMGGAIVSDAVSAMSKIEDSSADIADIVTMINEIAFQTNLLALNAAVEAARAGDAGKGFAVVASEVRALAQRSSEASTEIKSLIDSSVSQIKDGVGLVNQTGETLEEIVSSVKHVADIVSEITAASQEQSTGLDEINTAVSSMDEMTQQNAALVEQTTAAAQSLEEQANGLSKLISFFSTDETGSNAPQASPPQEPQAKKRPTVQATATVVEQAPSAPIIADGFGDDDDDWQEF